MVYIFIIDSIYIHLLLITSNNIRSFIWIYIYLFSVFGFVLSLGFFLDNFYIVFSPRFSRKARFRKSQSSEFFTSYVLGYFYFNGFILLSDVSLSSLLIGLPSSYCLTFGFLPSLNNLREFLHCIKNLTNRNLGIVSFAGTFMPPYFILFIIIDYWFCKDT